MHPGMCTKQMIPVKQTSSSVYVFIII